MSLPDSIKKKEVDPYKRCMLGLTIISLLLAVLITILVLL